MYNYHSDIVWMADKVMFFVLTLIIIVIFFCVLLNNFFWKRRYKALYNIKLGLSEMVLAHHGASSKNICQPFIENVTTAQFIDIVTNRKIDAAFFNDSEKKLFLKCFSNPDVLSNLQKAAISLKDKWRRIEALLALGYTHAQSSIDILKNALLSKDTDVAYFSIISLGQIKNIRSAIVLLEFLRKDPSHGYKIVSILENFSDDIAPEVVKLTDYYDPMVRYWALRLLTKMKPDGYIDRIQKLTLDPNVEVSAAACDCLGSTGNERVSSTLLRCMKDDSWLVRSHAVLALEKVLGAAALPEAIKLINDASWSVLDSVKDVMASHIETSLPYIERFLEGSDEIAKKYSVLALEDSGYITKLLTMALSEDDKNYALRILKGIVRSRVRFGLDAAINHLQPAMHVKARDLIDSIGNNQ